MPITLTDEQLSRWIAEKLEPKPTYSPKVTGHIGLSVMTDLSTHSVAWQWDFQSKQWHPRDLVSNPEMTVMLMEKMHEFGNVVIAGDNGWGVSVYFIDENGIETWYSRPSQTNNQLLGRAVAEAWALANGYHEDAL